MPQTDWQGNLVGDYWDDWDPSVNYWEGFQQPEIGGGWNDPMKYGPFNQPLHSLIVGGGNNYNAFSDLGKWGDNPNNPGQFDPNITIPIDAIFNDIFNKNKNLAPGQTPGFNPEATTPSAGGGNSQQGGNNMSTLKDNAFPLIMTGLSALSGWLNNRESARTSTSKQSGTSTSVDTYSNQPQYDELGTDIREFLWNQLQDRAKNSPDFVKSYIAGSIKNLNASSDITKRLMENTVASRGLGRTSAGAAPLMNLEGSRIMQALLLKSQGPLIEEDLKSKRLKELTDFFSLQPVGQSGTSTRTSTFDQAGEQIGPGSPLGSALSAGGATLGYFGSRGNLSGIFKPPTNPYQLGPYPGATPPFNPNAGGYINPQFQLPPIFDKPKFPTGGGN